MPASLDFIARVDDDGRLSRAAALRVKHNLAARAGGEVRIRVSEPVRSPKQNAFYWLQLGRIAGAYADAGLDYSAELLHRWYKIRFLPAVAAELERETGEAVDYVRVHAYPDGSEERVYTTTRLSRDAFSLYMEHVRAEAEAELGLSLDDTPGGLRSGRILEPAA